MKNLDRFTEPLIELGAKLNNFKPLEILRDAFMLAFPLTILVRLR